MASPWIPPAITSRTHSGCNNTRMHESRQSPVCKQTMEDRLLSYTEPRVSYVVRNRGTLHFSPLIPLSKQGMSSNEILLARKPTRIPVIDSHQTDLFAFEQCPECARLVAQKMYATLPNVVKFNLVRGARNSFHRSPTLSTRCLTTIAKLPLRNFAVFGARSVRSRLPYPIGRQLWTNCSGRCVYHTTRTHAPR